MRGQVKASLERTLVITRYNLKRLSNLGMSLQRSLKIHPIAQKQSPDQTTHLIGQPSQAKRQNPSDPLARN